MNYTELKAIVDKNITRTSDIVPQDTASIASHLSLHLKNSIECKEDCKGKTSPLEHCNSCYAIYRGEYTIYYNEKYAYQNFSIAHEIAYHLLGYTADGTAQHHDAQLMAAIIVAPEDLIHKYRIKSTVELAETCKIPVDVAEEYWSEIKTTDNIMNTNTNKTYEDAIQELFINATCSYCGTPEESLSETLEAKTKGKMDTVMNMIAEKDRVDAEEFITDMIFEYREAFYIEGFRRAIKLIFDGLIGNFQPMTR